MATFKKRKVLQPVSNWSCHFFCRHYWNPSSLGVWGSHGGASIGDLQWWWWTKKVFLPGDGVLQSKIKWKDEVIVDFEFSRNRDVKEALALGSQCFERDHMRSDGNPQKGWEISQAQCFPTFLALRIPRARHWSNIFLTDTLKEENVRRPP